MNLRRNPGEADEKFGFFYDILKPLDVFERLSLTQRVELVALVALLQSRSRDWREDRYV